ncbi:hypothetical protein [Flavobacterium sp. HNIBRBA15423]|uniref:hypothetical protein n=1 Tax=Flavobacterium sp. HNIBRBA15423 TaxID=3458683 RepID=UPI0040440120
MSQLLDKVISNIHLCGVAVAINGTYKPSDIEGWQPFYNSTFENAEFNKAYASISSINYNEESINSPSGVSFKSKVSFRFPNSDPNKSERIEFFRKVKFIKLKQTNGLDIIIGRNDFNQNAKPKIKVKMNEQLCEVSFESESISPSGFSPSENSFGLPVLIPLTLV